MPVVSVELSADSTSMGPSVVDHTVAPPGYTSEVDAATPLQSIDPTSGDHAVADELISTQTHTQPCASSISSAQATPRHSDVHFNGGSPNIQRSRTVASRRRYFSLPYGGSTVTFPVHLTYHPSNNPSVIDVTVHEREFEPELPALGNPSMQHLHEKLTSGPPASRNSTIRLNPANYILLSRKGTPKRFFALTHTSSSIKGKFTVNPFLHVPAALLAPGSLPSGRDRDAAENVRKNLKFEVENGGIDVEIFLIGEPDPELDSGVRDADNAVLRTTLDLKIRHGGSSGSKKNNFPLIAKIVSYGRNYLIVGNFIKLTCLIYPAHPDCAAPTFPPYCFRTRWIPFTPPTALLPRASYYNSQTHQSRPYSQSRSESPPPSRFPCLALFRVLPEFDDIERIGTDKIILRRGDGWMGKGGARVGWRSCGCGSWKGVGETTDVGRKE